MLVPPRFFRDKETFKKRNGNDRIDQTDDSLGEERLEFSQRAPRKGKHDMPCKHRDAASPWRRQGKAQVVSLVLFNRHQFMVPVERNRFRLKRQEPLCQLCYQSLGALFDSRHSLMGMETS